MAARRRSPLRIATPNAAQGRPWQHVDLPRDSSGIAGASAARRPFDGRRNPARHGGGKRNVVVGEVPGWRDRDRKRRGCRRSRRTGTAGPAGRMLLVRTLVAGHVLMSDSIRGMDRRLRHDPGFIAVIHRLDAVACSGAMRHRARQVDRGGDTLHGQRHDQYPQHEESDQRAHVSNLAYAKMIYSHDTTSQHAWPLARSFTTDPRGKTGLSTSARTRLGHMQEPSRGLPYSCDRRYRSGRLACLAGRQAVLFLRSVPGDERPGPDASQGPRATGDPRRNLACDDRSTSSVGDRRSRMDRLFSGPTSSPPRGPRTRGRGRFGRAQQ